MSSKRRDEVIDEDGNVLPPPEPGSPVGQLIYLMEYARKRGFQIGPNVQVDGVIVQVRDLRQAAQQQHTDEGDRDLAPGSDMHTLFTGGG